MVTKKKVVKKSVKKVKKVEEAEEEESGGMGLDDAFGDDEGVEYAESKPKKTKKGKEDLDDELEEAEEEVEQMEKQINGGDEIKKIVVKESKPVIKIKKGDKIKVDSLDLEVDGHYVLIDHGTTKEMAIECFDPKTDKDYQLRYFSDNAEDTMEFYELQEIMYLKKQANKVEW